MTEDRLEQLRQHFEELNAPRTTKGRAHRALTIMEAGGTSLRAYDNCFEMGDGDAVVRYLLRMARANRAAARTVAEKGKLNPEIIDQFKAIVASHGPGPVNATA